MDAADQQDIDDIYASSDDEDDCENNASKDRYVETFKEPIEQVVILIVTEDGAIQSFVKNKKDYLPLLGPAIKEFNESFNEN